MLNSFLDLFRICSNEACDLGSDAFPEYCSGWDCTSWSLLKHHCLCGEHRAISEFQQVSQYAQYEPNHYISALHFINNGPATCMKPLYRARCLILSKKKGRGWVKGFLSYQTGATPSHVRLLTATGMRMCNSMFKTMEKVALNWWTGF